MRRSSKRAKYQLVNPTHKDKAAPAELELLHTRTLLCIRNFTHHKGGPEAAASVERLFRDYKKHKEEIKKQLLKTFEYLIEEYPNMDIETGIKEAKKAINVVAKKIWG